MIKKKFLSLIVKLKNNIRKKNIDDTKNSKTIKTVTNSIKTNLKTINWTQKTKTTQFSRKINATQTLIHSKNENAKKKSFQFNLLHLRQNRLHIFQLFKKNDNKRFKINVAKTKKKIDFRKNRFVRRKQTKNKNRKIHQNEW